MAGSDQLGEFGSPFILGEVFGMSVSRPNTLKDDFILGLVTGAAIFNVLNETKKTGFFDVSFPQS